MSNLVVNKYTDFGAGFSIDYVTRPASVEDIMGNYEAKILGIDGNELLVDKSFIQAAEEFGVTVSGDPTIPRFFDTWFIRYRYNDPDNLYTYLVFGDVEKSLIINFKPVQTAEYPGGVAFKLLNPLPDGIEKLDLCYIAEEVTPSLVETLELIPFIDEKVPDTVLRVPDFSNFESYFNSLFEKDYSQPPAFEAPEFIPTIKQVEQLVPWLSQSGNLLQVYQDTWSETGDPNFALAAVRDSEDYDNLFPGNKRADGSVRHNESEYKAIESGYKNVIIENGLNPKLFENKFGGLI